MPTLPTRKKVAAYARVSMETERLHHSLSAQVSYYSDLIQRNPEWEYAGVYADDGITGTKANSRGNTQASMLTTASQAQRRTAERNSSACWRIARPGRSTSS